MNNMPPNLRSVTPSSPLPVLCHDVCVLETNHLCLAGRACFLVLRIDVLFYTHMQDSSNMAFVGARAIFVINNFDAINKM